MTLACSQCLYCVECLLLASDVQCAHGLCAGCMYVCHRPYYCLHCGALLAPIFLAYECESFPCLCICRVQWRGLTQWGRGCNGRAVHVWRCMHIEVPIQITDDRTEVFFQREVAGKVSLLKTTVYGLLAQLCLDGHPRVILNLHKSARNENASTSGVERCPGSVSSAGKGWVMSPR